MLIHSAGIPTKRELVLKKQLDELVEKYGGLDPRVLKKSKQLDIVIAQRQRALKSS